MNVSSTCVTDDTICSTICWHMESVKFAGHGCNTKETTSATVAEKRLGYEGRDPAHAGPSSLYQI